MRLRTSPSTEEVDRRNIRIALDTFGLSRLQWMNQNHLLIKCICVWRNLLDLSLYGDHKNGSREKDTRFCFEYKWLLVPTLLKQILLSETSREKQVTQDPEDEQRHFFTCTLHFHCKRASPVTPNNRFWAYYGEKLFSKSPTVKRLGNVTSNVRT